MEFESFNPSGLAQHLHADGLPKGDCRSSHSPVPTGYICADCRGKMAQLIVLKSQYGVRLFTTKSCASIKFIFCTCSVLQCEGLPSPFLGLFCENML